MSVKGEIARAFKDNEEAYLDRFGLDAETEAAVMGRDPCSSRQCRQTDTKVFRSSKRHGSGGLSLPPDSAHLLTSWSRCHRSQSENLARLSPGCHGPLMLFANLRRAGH